MLVWFDNSENRIAVDHHLILYCNTLEEPCQGAVFGNLVRFDQEHVRFSWQISISFLQLRQDHLVVLEQEDL